ncbi:tRNA ligase, partial [Coemansia spiralis]
AGGAETIAARGYDKFFNVDEVAWTKWDWIEAHTRGPYELTVKENGCLILAAGIDGGRTLLVTSKHAVNVPHAATGMAWAQRHLAQAGRSPDELAGFLHDNNATAVFELCDDEFEEHILEYPDRTRGLYLHGINRNAVDLATWPSADVARVAAQFGFHATQYFTFDSAADGRAFADQVRRDHVLDGRAIEGFVVRCQTAADGRPFMFKIKYDEPYLMFREWREVTNRIIGGKPFRTHYALTRQYAAWVKAQLKTSPDDFGRFGKNKGIIAARKRFLAYHQAHGGSQAEVYDQTDDAPKVLLMPVATVGCGKTTLALALETLFGCGHVQNDNITTKKNPRGAFHRAVLDAFDSHAFVVADRMNHTADMRQSLTAAVRDELVSCRIVALYWPHDRAPDSEILAATTARVVARGEDHQSLTPKRTPKFRDIMRGNLRCFAPLDLESPSDGLVDHVIELDPLADAAANLQTAVDGLCALFPSMLQPPSPADVARALDAALQYKPTVRKDVGRQSKGQDKGKGQGKDQSQVQSQSQIQSQIQSEGQIQSQSQSQSKPLYFGLVPQGPDLVMLVRKLLDSGHDAERDVCQRMVLDHGCKRPLHVTLAHIATRKRPEAKAVYDAYHALPRKQWFSGAAVAQCTADYVVCDGKTMALRVRVAAARKGQQLPPSVVCPPATPDGRPSLAATNAIPHITLSVAAGAKAVHSNDMLATVFGPDNADRPLARPDGWAVIPASLTFSAALKEFTC